MNSEKWQVDEKVVNGQIHIWPVNGEEHWLDTPRCWCLPVVERHESGVILVTHESLISRNVSR